MSVLDITPNDNDTEMTDDEFFNEDDASTEAATAVPVSVSDAVERVASVAVKVDEYGNARDEALKNIPAEQHARLMRVVADLNIKSDDPAWILFTTLIEQHNLISAGEKMAKDAAQGAIEAAKEQGKVSLNEYAKAAVDTGADAIYDAVAAAMVEPVNGAIKRTLAAHTRIETEALAAAGKVQAEAITDIKKLASITAKNVKDIKAIGEEVIEGIKNEIKPDSWSDRAKKLGATAAVVLVSAWFGAYLGIHYAVQNL